jgi:KDO2-lipid IV(A) lauroyltransferase
MQTAHQHAARRLARRGKSLGYFVLGWLALGALKLLRLTQPQWAIRNAGRLLRTIGRWFPEDRTGRANLQAAFPEWPQEKIEQVLSGVWENLGRLGAEFVHLDRLWPVVAERGELANIEFTPETKERFIRLRDDGKPALLFAAHLANWELPALAARAFGLKTVVLFRPPNIAQVSRLVLKIRSARMGLLVPTSLGAPTVVADELARGAHAGMLVDQYAHRGVDVTFFGRRTKANALIARLARHIDCPIHGTRVVRLPDGRLRVDLTEAIGKPRDAEGELDVAGTMQVITSIVEGWVREHPEQWLWLHRRWR